MSWSTFQSFSSLSTIEDSISLLYLRRSRTTRWSFKTTRTHYLRLQRARGCVRHKPCVPTMKHKDRLLCNPTRTPILKPTRNPPPGLYKGGPGYLGGHTHHEPKTSTPKRRVQYTTPQTRHRVRYSSDSNLYKSCFLWPRAYCWYYLRLVGFSNKHRGSISDCHSFIDARSQIKLSLLFQ
jgi:hypothetical protein